MDPDSEVVEAEPAPEAETPEAEPEGGDEEPERLIDPLSEEAVDEEFKDELAEAEAEAGADADDVEEFEWNNRKIKASKSVKADLDAIMADQQKKYQSLAEQRRELDENARRVQEQAQLSQEDINQRAEYVAIRKAIDQYGTVDWQAWSATDPGAAQTAFFELQKLREDAGRIGTEIEQRAHARTAAFQKAQGEATAKRLQETQEWVQKNIKGWKPETDKEVIDFAQAKGFDKQTLQAAMSPEIYRMIYLARIGEQVLNKPATPAPNAQKPTPLKTVGSKSSPTANNRPEDVTDMEQYVALRKKQMGAKGG